MSFVQREHKITVYPSRNKEVERCRQALDNLPVLNPNPTEMVGFFVVHYVPVTVVIEKLSESNGARYQWQVITPAHQWQFDTLADVIERVSNPLGNHQPAVMDYHSLAGHNKKASLL